MSVVASAGSHQIKDEHMPTLIKPEPEPEKPPVTDLDPLKVRTQAMSVITAMRGQNNRIAGQLIAEMKPDEVKAAFLFVCGSFSRAVDALAMWVPRDPDTDHKPTGDEILQGMARMTYAGD